MKDQNKTKTHLISELEEMRQQVSKLEQTLMDSAQWESEENFRSIVELSPNGIVTINLRGEVLSINRAFTEITGFTEHEMLGKHFSRLPTTPKALFSTITQTFSKIIKEKEIGVVEFEWQHKNGEMRNGEARVGVIKKGTKVTGVQVVLTDVTERVRTEESLNESLERLKGFDQHSTEGIYRIDITKPVPIDLPRAEMVDWINKYAIVGEVNDSLAQMYGFEPDDMIGRPAVDFAPNYGKRAVLVLEAEGYQIKNQETEDIDKDGKPLFLIENYHGIVKDGHLLSIWGAQNNITERVRVEDALREREEELQKNQALYREAERLGNIGHWERDHKDYKMTFCSEGFARIYEMSVEEILAFFSSYEGEISLIHPDDRARYKQILHDSETQRKEMDIEYRVILRSGLVRHIHQVSEFVLDEQGEIISWFGTVQDITERILAEEEARQQALEFSILFSVGQSLAQAPADSNEIASIMVRQYVDKLSLPQASVALYESQADAQHMLRYIEDYFDPDEAVLSLENWTGKLIPMSDYPDTLRAMETLEPQIIQASDPDIDSALLAYMNENEVKTTAYFPMAVKGHFIGLIEFESWFKEHHYTPQEINMAKALANQAAVAMENAQLFETAQHEIAERKIAEESLQKSQALYRQAELMGKMGHWEWDHKNYRMTSCSPQFAQFYEMSMDKAVAFFSSYESEINVVHPDDRAFYEKALRDSERERRGIDVEYRIIVPSGTVKHMHQRSNLVLDDQGEIITSFGTVQDITQRMQAEEDARQKAVESSILFSVSQMLAQASPDPDEIALIMARQFVDALGLPEVSIALYDSQDGILRFLVDYYNPSNVGDDDENWAGKAISVSDYPDVIRVMETLEPFIAQISDPNIDSTTLDFMTKEGTKTEAIFPMAVKGRFIGIIELETWSEEYHYTPREIDLAMVLANQTAVALERAQLQNNLKQSNEKLVRAYDVTIAGWAQALELRDMETEGHSRRVVEITIELAQALGIKSEEHLQHIRRGALLHDVGKMGVPDSILKKHENLNAKEWEIMHQHPIYAYQWLSAAEYLVPALDIPYCHHEKWDGTGYPRGLKNEEIPFVARIFAIVDVWDALLSDRPYRKAWPQKKVLAYLQEQSGLHFDPQVVDAFIKVQSEKEFAVRP